MKITCKNREFSVRGKKFCFFITSISIGFNYWHSGLPWYGTKRDFKLRLAFIPDDIEFWNHVLWVIPNPEFIQRFVSLNSLGLTVLKNVRGEYFVSESIPF